MSRPRIRIGEATTDFERELLGSWEHERPPVSSRRKTLALVGSGVAVGATSTTVASGAIGGALAPAAAPKAASLGVVVIAKWIVAGSVVAAGVVTAAPYVSRAIPRSTTVTAPSAVVMAAPAPPSLPGQRSLGAPGGNPVAPVAAVSPPSEVPAVPAVLPVPPAPAVGARAQGPDALKGIGPAVPAAAGARVAASRVAAPVAASEPAPAPAPAPEAPAAAAPDVSPSPAVADTRPLGSLGDQVASLDTARSALASGHPLVALRAVDDYDARFPGGMLSQEAAVVRIDALERLGRREEAASIGQRFIESHPASPYAAKVRQLLTQPPAEP
ncbi:MAG: hypothetical protein ACRENE_01385 [Polyangiaceae bacterium]